MLAATVSEFLRNLEFYEDVEETISCDTCLADRSFCGMCIMNERNTEEEEE
jgi:hypothetical protein